MSNSIYQTSDPWENGWATENNTTNQPSHSSTVSPLPVYGQGSSYLTSSQLLNTTNIDNDDDEENTISLSNVPESYLKVHSALSEQLSTVNDLESLVFARLIQLDFVTNYQKSKILDIIYDHNLLPLTIENNFYQVLGLIALEIDVPGSGDYVTLQFRLNNLPQLPSKFVDAVVNGSGDSDFIDPLNARLAKSSLVEDEPVKLSDPILADHSSAGLINNDNIVNRPDPVDNSYITKHVNSIRDTFKPLINANDLIKIKEVPEKEGLLFKHINYIITHDLVLGMNGHGGTKKVIRRYSDFVWLLEFLLQKYPFRVIPGLPPKKFSVGSSPDSQFLQRRRRGLHRFLNQLVKHPVLKQEPVVITFLSVPTDIQTWRKQAKIDNSIEFKGEKISTNFINLIWPKIGEEFLQNWQGAEKSINKLIEIWTKTVLLVERYEKRQQQISYDNGKFVEMINNFKSLNTKLYPNENKVLLGENSTKDDINLINDSLGYISEFFNKSSQTLIDDSYSINTIILEKFKNYLDYLYSLQELFERTKRLSINTIDQLEKRIRENEAKYNKSSTEDADVKGADLAKLRQVIINDKQEIFQQLNRDWLIKNCCFEEFLMFQETQYLISELWIDWSKGRFKFQEKLFGLHENLNNEIANDMPTTR
ncbi:Mvp1 protein [Scheffersomyces xylosifermentans]|uniref:Mvp1 protein n=1 Tax=Scheffersomyces xylosifermentans TaxID=1304137 RepID=UPI00315D58C1